MSNCLLDCLQFVDSIATKLKIAFNTEDRYHSIIATTRHYLAKNQIQLSPADRQYAEQLLLDLHIPYLTQNIFRVLNPLEATPGDTSEYTLSMLDDTQLLAYFMLVMATITYQQNGHLLLVKYSINIWTTGFHDLAKRARGRVYDMRTWTTISYPFDKFFNLGEVPETNQELIKSYLAQADYIYATDKKDGSTITVSNYNGHPLITTNGSFENDQITWAREILAEKYPTFLKNVPKGYTYIFELIHPENRIVLDYGSERDLYLLSTRDLSTEKLLHLNEIHAVAHQYGFPYPEVYDFTDLDIMVELAATMTDANKEGWVIRIGVGNAEHMVKLKLTEYFSMHHAFDKIKLGWVYKHLLANDLDDFSSLCTPDQQDILRTKKNIVQATREKIKNKAIVQAEQHLAEAGLTQETFMADRERMIALIKTVQEAKTNVTPYVIQYLKDPTKVDALIEKITYKAMRNFFLEFGEKVDE